jgi:hypothetical protein
VRNPDGSLVLGRTRWRRFALAVVPAAAAVGALMFGVMAGAFPSQFTVSGLQFKVSADRLEGTGFSQFPGWDTTADGTNLPVARSVIDHAELSGLCQSVRLPDIALLLFPGKDALVLRIEAGNGSTPAEADNLVIGLTELSGNAVFGNIQIGNDAGELSGVPLLAGQPGQRADTIAIDDLRQLSYSTTAGSFRLPGLSLKVIASTPSEPDGECF